MGGKIHHSRPFEGPFLPLARAQNLDVSAISPYTSAAPRMDLISNPAVSPPSGLKASGMAEDLSKCRGAAN
jgi:hypothetical protein